MSGSNRIEELATLFSDLREKSLQSGETVESIRFAFLREVKDYSASRARSKKFWVYFILPVLIAVACYHFEVIELSHLREEPCLINVNEISIEVTRKPSNCSLVCDGLNMIPRVSELSKDEFLMKYAYTGRPVVVTDAAKNWSATERFNFTFFKQLFEKNENAYQVNEDECQFFPYRTEFVSLKEAMNMSKERSEWKGKPWYFGWSNCDPTIREELRHHYDIPYFLPNQSETSDQDWIFMGGPGPGAQIHIDSVERPSWQAQLSGQKVWTLIPPPECEHVCHAMTTVINKGEIIIVDTNQWYHSTKVLPGDLSITIGAEYD
ncbi:bifunctional arginine demethylase and lysyl-hydroxylase JMJD6-like [Acropora millepora]|uniref:bifunctional arginine demethylase and lysyl-hydroxylase JMJD6-like n=1 Tax=Acropora millepora TaxID=45264 RepID=UPI0010FCA220|nr:bifunctional arginine demethylase and lysyl-hydroxylase JMJD6-like [Acropora millepora]